jgi:hypothetical protein
MRTGGQFFEPALVGLLKCGALGLRAIEIAFEFRRVDRAIEICEIPFRQRTEIRCCTVPFQGRGGGFAGFRGGSVGGGFWRHEGMISPGFSTAIISRLGHGFATIAAGLPTSRFRA